MNTADLSQSRLKTWRLAHGLSQADVAGLAGISCAMVSRVENHKAQAGPLTKVRIARALGVSVSELFDPPKAA